MIPVITLGITGELSDVVVGADGGVVLLGAVVGLLGVVGVVGSVGVAVVATGITVKVKAPSSASL